LLAVSGFQEFSPARRAMQAGWLSRRSSATRLEEIPESPEGRGLCGTTAALLCL